MTQLFDTQTYEDLDETGTTPHTPGASGAAGAAGAAGDSRHLRSIPAGDERAAQTIEWRLDEQTIQTGRKGIQAARKALQNAARESSTDQKPARKAA